MEKNSKYDNPRDMFSEIEKFIKDKYGPQYGGGTGAAAQTASDEPQGEQQKKAHESVFDFNLKPQDIKSYLDRYVIAQEEAKKVLSIAVCDHYNHVIESKKEDSNDEEYAKQNVILVGPTGVGKTYLVKHIAKLIGVPFVKADATKFSETGYVGGDVEDLVRDLVRKADNDVELAEYGIIYLDEIDKVAAPRKSMNRDVSGRGVQMNLLKLLEDTDVPLRSPMDMAGQFQALMEMQTKGKSEKKTINTKNILFIVSGAFNGLDEIVKERIGKRGIGFNVDVAGKNETTEYLSSLRSSDFVEFGFEPEFIGRLPVHTVCHQLTVDHLFNILKYSEGSIIRQLEKSFVSYGVEAIFSDEGLRAIAEKALEEETGARGLLTICENRLREFKYLLPSSEVNTFVVTRELIENPQAEIEKLFQNGAYNEKNVFHEQLREYEEEFYEKTGITIGFNNEAEEHLYEQAKQLDKSVKEICRGLLKDYEYGLNLIAKTSGQKEFELTEEVLKDPSGTLDAWVRDSYTQRDQNSSGPMTK
jgi:endopeptidase Clp ATP-binding regulatory subunit ClpX